ncbi:M24 family metallopeptidase [Halolamina litorea]|uniref:M24 family metallopeptidase n=1 Tax=Halolamina litorea TaxID=1515593 RepID=A0ABD6BMQ1_9EURY|nr:Xaa-Pro peptidase family protein [Halolamina litorea]
MMDYRGRQAAVQDELADAGIDFAVFGAGPDLQYLTGSSIDWRRYADLGARVTSLFLPAEGEPVLLAGPFAGEESDLPCAVRGMGLFDDPGSAVAAVIDDVADARDTVAVGDYTEGSVTLALTEACPDADLVSAEGLVGPMRAIKTPEEIEALREAAELTDRIMADVVENVEAGDTMREVGLEIEHRGRMAGASDVSFSSTAGFCHTGVEPSGEVFNYDPDEPLESGTSIAFDVGFVHNGYCSDWGRSVYFGEPPEHIASAYEALMTAVVETIDAIGDEVQTVDDLFPYVEQVCDREGYGEYLRNRHETGIVGHQIGVEVHESPWLRPDNDDELEEGMVFCLEPKLWNDGEYYLRVEDMVHVTADGAESLTRFDRERFVV